MTAPKWVSTSSTAYLLTKLRELEKDGPVSDLDDELIDAIMEELELRAHDAADPSAGELFGHFPS